MTLRAEAIERMAIGAAEIDLGKGCWERMPEAERNVWRHRQQFGALPALLTLLAERGCRVVDGKQLAASVLQVVLEMDDRTSPEDWPEALLVTGDELTGIIEEHVKEFPNPLAAEDPAHGCGRRWRSRCMPRCWISNAPACATNCGIAIAPATTPTPPSPLSAPMMQGRRRVVELKACPFCGGKPELDNSDRGPWEWVECTSCGAQGPGHRDDAAPGWNRRASPWLPLPATPTPGVAPFDGEEWLVCNAASSGPWAGTKCVATWSDSPSYGGWLDTVEGLSFPATHYQPIAPLPPPPVREGG